VPKEAAFEGILARAACQEILSLIAEVGKSNFEDYLSAGLASEGEPVRSEWLHMNLAAYPIAS
jgi:hypothetical protein